MTSISIRPRLLSAPPNKSFFLFGPRGTGKSTWVQNRYHGSIFVDLLDSAVYNDLLSRPERLELLLPSGYAGWVIIDEVQRIPTLLNEVHRLIEKRRLRFVLTGSSARKLRRRGVNLLAGRALTLEMHPFTAEELGSSFTLKHALEFGMLPATWAEEDPAAFLESYVHAYLREEVQQEGLVRNLSAFARFLEAASFSQAALLNVSSVARDCGAERKTVEGYFEVLDDLLLAVRLQPFSRRAKRRVVSHPKFYFFDSGVYRTIRPSGPLDPAAELAGTALETLVLQHLRAVNAAHRYGYTIGYWRDPAGHEVDFVLYGKRGFHAVEVQRSARVRDEDLASLKLFLADYPDATGTVVFTGSRPGRHGDIEIAPIGTFLTEISDRIG